MYTVKFLLPHMIVTTAENPEMNNMLGFSFRTWKNELYLKVAEILLKMCYHIIIVSISDDNDNNTAVAALWYSD